MATRGRIGLELSNGSILSVYHHWDSYPAWLGKTLQREYNTKEKVTELIDGGDMSTCWSDSIWVEQLPEGEYAPETYAARGENCPPRLDKDKKTYLTNDIEEYHYIFTSAGWVCYDMHQFQDELYEKVEIPA